MQPFRWAGISRATGGVAIALALGLTASASAAVVVPVSAGPPKPVRAAHLDFNGFFPSATRIRVGDSVSFSINGFHTVTFLPKGEALPPLITVNPARPVAGRLDSAGGSFWFNGQPSQAINPVVSAPAGGKTYNGKGLLNSGLPAPTGPPKPFIVKFTKAGTFAFYCLVHPGMKGVVKVLPKKSHVPSVKLDKLAAKDEQKVANAEAMSLRRVKPAANTVLAGNDGNGPVAWLRFFPDSLKVKAGTSVEFKLSSKREVHTITIGPAPYTTEIENTFTVPQPLVGAPPVLLVSPLAAYPSDPPPLPAFTGTNHGNGFESSGILSNAGGPLPSSVKITFTKPGVYLYECVIHANMDGKITVVK
jgi:plastocyanin